jgi:hypothetical protein
MIGETDDEADSDTQSETENGEGREQTHPYSSAFDSRIKAQSVARVGGNGEWGIHGIIGKEVIDGVIHYCVDWQPTMLPLNQLLGAQHLIRDFEAKELGKANKRWKNEYHRHQKQK